MFRLRMSVAVLCVLSFVICAVWAKPKQLTKKQKEDQAVCGDLFTVCDNACGAIPPCTECPDATIYNNCEKNCENEYEACIKKAGVPTIQVPTTHLPPKVPTGQPLQPTSSPASSPKRKLPPTGPLTQASPTATPKRLTRQPQGTLTQASPSSSPNTIFHATKKENKKGGH